MPINLTGNTIASTFDQLLHVDDGPTATEKTVYSGTGVATALKVGTQSASVDNLQMDGNTLRALNTNGGVVILPNGAGAVIVAGVVVTGGAVTTLDTNGNLVLDPNGTGVVVVPRINITGGAISGITDLAVADGGTGASTATNARINLGLGSIATQSANNVAITGGAISGITDLTVADGGTGASTAGDARTNLGLGTIATQAANNVAITGGAISDVTFTGSFVGITLIESDKFSTKNGTDGVSLEDNNIFAEGASANIGIDIAAKGTGEVNITSKFGYGTGVGGTVTQLTNKATGVTLNKLSGQITMNNATLNRNSGVSFTLTNSFIAATDVVVACIASGATLTAYSLNVTAVSAGSCSLHLHNLLSGTDLSEALVLNFIVIKGVAA